MRGTPALLSSLLLPLMLGGCGFNLTDDGECAPHHEEAIPTSDGRHVAERWVSICGFPGATVTDLISVTEGPIAQPPWEGVFAFNEGGAGSKQVSAAWIDDHRLLITIDAFGDVRASPHRIGGVDVSYALGPSADVRVLEAKRDEKIEERRQWERLKTSASWHVIQDRYDLDADLIARYQKVIDWAKDNVGPRP